jgi:hypothetical protein
MPEGTEIVCFLGIHGGDIGREVKMANDDSHERSVGIQEEGGYRRLLANVLSEAHPKWERNGHYVKIGIGRAFSDCLDDREERLRVLKHKEAVRLPCFGKDTCISFYLLWIFSLLVELGSQSDDSRDYEFDDRHVVLYLLSLMNKFANDVYGSIEKVVRSKRLKCKREKWSLCKG